MAKSNLLSVCEPPDIAFSIPDPPTNIVLGGKDGKKAIIDFSGDSVSYSGELAVEESARIFFNAVFEQFAKLGEAT